ncbi:Hypothetical_protein [Hexamita inflata]|uniref:Hypothetical_protein n=1 Tax=Hexamita inflata TaxID=28002 RepID=A0AA86NS26_9EUKA|nr:Hypothetical protein HINF_LOCUS12583 [Hexamita inflata]
MQICSNKLVDKQQIQYCLKAVSLSSLTQSSQVVSSPAQEVFHSLYTEKTQDLKIDLIYSMKNLPSFALFGLTKSIEIFDSNLSVKIPQPQSKSALICFQCDINSSASEFAFLAQAQMISGLIYCPYTIMVLNSSLIQFRLTGINVGGLIFQTNNIQVQIFICNISGYLLNDSISGIFIVTATNSSTIEVQDVIICVQFNDIIGDNQIGSGVDRVQISGNFIQSCDLCGGYYFTYGLCLEYLNFGEVVNNTIICLHSFVFDGEGCSCPEGQVVNETTCVDILGSVNLLKIQQEQINTKILDLVLRTGELESIQQVLTSDQSTQKGQIQILFDLSNQTQNSISNNFTKLQQNIFGNYSLTDKNLQTNTSVLDQRIFNNVSILSNSILTLNTYQPFKQKSIVSETYSLRRSGSKLSYQYILTQQDLPSLNSAVPPAGFEFKKMKNISLLLPVGTARTSSDPSSFTDNQSCYIKCSSLLNSTFVPNSSRIWNSIILILFGDSYFILLLLRYNIKTHI